MLEGEIIMVKIVGFIKPGMISESFEIFKMIEDHGFELCKDDICTKRMNRLQIDMLYSHVKDNKPPIGMTPEEFDRMKSYLCSSDVKRFSVLQAGGLEQYLQLKKLIGKTCHETNPGTIRGRWTCERAPSWENVIHINDFNSYEDYGNGCTSWQNDILIEPNRHKYIIQYCNHIGLKSNCCRQKVGCVIIDGDALHAVGNNLCMDSTRRPYDLCIRDIEKIKSGTQTELCYALHAEMSVLLRLNSSGDYTLYCSHLPCPNCTRMIISWLNLNIYNVNTIRVIYGKSYGDGIDNVLYKNIEGFSRLKILALDQAVD